MENQSSTVIRPEIVASIIAALRQSGAYSLERDFLARRPRFPELLWFLQAMSMQDGGLAAFANDFLAHYPERIGNKAVWQIGASGLRA